MRSRRKQRAAFWTVCGILLSGQAAFAGFITYSGSLHNGGGGLAGTGIWMDGGTTLDWTVSRSGDGPWHYEYTLSVPRGEVSHMIIEVSPAFGKADVFNAEGPFHKIEIQTYQCGPGCPFMPGDIHGMKFDDTYGETVHISFDSWRIPVWGDFYAKDGKVGGEFNTVCNSGFTGGDLDPTGPPAGGSLGSHILVPDTYIPEPATLLIFGLGLRLLHRRR